MKFGGFDLCTDDSLISTYEISGFTIVKVGLPGLIYLMALAGVIIGLAVI